jgi:hypothetical protein
MAMRSKHGGGRKLSIDGAYARKLGVRKNLVKRRGGAEKLQALTPAIRRILLNTNKLREATA